MNYKKEIGVGLFFLILSGVYIGLSFSIISFDPFGNSYITSKAMPQLLGGLVLAISVIHIIITYLKMIREKAAQKQSSDKDPCSRIDSEKKSSAKKIRFDRASRLMLITILLTAAYIFCFTRLGFVLSSVLFLLLEIFMLVAPEKRRSWAIFIVCFSVGIPVGLYMLFTKALSMFLPRGLIGW